MRKAVVIDLDGTLVATNTFTRFVSYLFFLLLKKGKIKDAAAIAWAVMLRKLRRIPHSKAKHMIMSVANCNITPEEYHTFATLMARYARPQVMNLIKELESRGHVAVLATAAPEEYSVTLGALLGIGHTVATIHTDSYENYSECKEGHKFDAVNRLCSSLGCQTGTVITDHHHDLPLMRQPGVDNILICPDSATLQLLQQLSIPYSILD